MGYGDVGRLYSEVWSNFSKIFSFVVIYPYRSTDWVMPNFTPIDATYRPCGAKTAASEYGNYNVALRCWQCCR